MNVKKILPVLLLIVMAVAVIFIRRCNTAAPPVATELQAPVNTTPAPPAREAFDRTTTNLFFTKHAKCRMRCRHISQQEVKDILVRGKINYRKSDLDDPRGPSYAVEGTTKDGQRVRVVFAPRKQHLTVVTVMDLEREYVCNC